MAEPLISTFTQTESGAWILDISEVLDLVRKKDIALMGQITIGGVAINKKHSWLKDEMAYERVTSTNDAAGTLIIGETAMTVNLAERHDKRLRVGTIIKDVAPGKGSEQYQITVIAATTPYGLTLRTWPAKGVATIDHAAAAIWRIISNPVKEASDPSTAEATARAMSSNYIQLFEKGISISDETRNMKFRAVDSEEKFQIEKKTWELKRELGFSLIYGMANEPADIDDYGTMGGLISLIGASGGNVTDAGGVELTRKMVNDLAEMIREDAGVPEIIVIGTKQSRLMSDWGDQYIRTRSTETVLGNYVDTFLTDTGLRLPIILDDELDTEYLMMLTKSMCKLVPYNNEAWSLYVWPRTKYAQTTTMKGAYTFEIRNALKCHGLIKNLAEPALT